MNLTIELWNNKAKTDRTGGKVNSTIIFGDFSTSLSLIERTYKQKVNTNRKILKNTILEFDLIDIYKTFHIIIVVYIGW